jgi:hypothetical protein
MFEGPLNITAVATDDDGATTTLFGEIDVLNIAPTLSPPQLWKGGQEVLPDENGTWHVFEDEVVLLRANAQDSANDQGTLLVEWHPSIDDENWTVTSVGILSSETVSWANSGLHTVNVRAIDADGAASPTLEAYVRVHNVAPAIAWEGLTASQSIISVAEDDDLLNLSVSVTDTESDLAGLVVCWDFDATVDLDRDGQSDNDCETTGLWATPTWSTQGPRTVTVTVTDDDGESAKEMKNISVRNMPPLAVISEVSVLEGLVEGDNLTLSGSSSIETEGDRTTLAFAWDSSHLDTDLDGEKTGDVDFTGPNWTIENLPAGTWTISLTVTDDNGEFHRSEITVVVAPAPVEGIIESITEALGGTMTAVIGLLGLVIVGLVIFLLFSRQGSSTKDDAFGIFDQSAFAGQPAVAPTATIAPVHPLTSVPTNSTPAVAMPPMDAAPVAAGPPVPATGLPQGWTMEQWVHYGEQWLAANQPAPAPVQPIPSQTPPAPATSTLQSLLDDLDF